MKFNKGTLASVTNTTCLKCKKKVGLFVVAYVVYQPGFGLNEIRLKRLG